MKALALIILVATGTVLWLVNCKWTPNDTQ